MHFGQRNGFISSIFFCHFFIVFLQIYFTSSSPTSNIQQQKRHFLLPSYLFKTNEQPKRQNNKPTVEMVPIDAPPQFDQSLDVPANIFPVRKVPKEPFAMRPCYFSPIQCLLHTPEHDRKFQNYPEFQQNAYSRGNMEQMPSQNTNNLQINPSGRVKAAVVEALLAQKQLMGKKVKARRMLRQSEAIGGGMEEDGNGPQRGGMGMGRQRLFGNPWRRGL